MTDRPTAEAQFHDQIVDIVGAEPIGPDVRRITLGGAGLAPFLDGHRPGDAVQVLVTQDGQPSAWHPGEAPRSAAEMLQRMRDAGVVARVYTLVRPDHHRGTLDLEIVQHGDAPGTRFAANARPGQQMRIGGPRYGYDLPAESSHQLLIADEAATPAAIDIMRRLADGMPVTAIFVLGAGGRPRDLPPDPAHTITWLDRPSLDGLLVAIDRHIATVPDLHLWCAIEAHDLAVVRRHLRKDRDLPRERTRFAAYWRRDHTLDDSGIGHVPPNLVAAVREAGLDPHDIDNIEPSVDLPPGASTSPNR